MNEATFPTSVGSAAPKATRLSAAPLAAIQFALAIIAAFPAVVALVLGSVQGLARCESTAWREPGYMIASVGALLEFASIFAALALGAKRRREANIGKFVAGLPARAT